ncbi:MAG: hypothetical protein EKK47_19720 [Burkholderiales bacterium]|jgi:hypothetical protein|nr:MAG: hypothetical protein EKK47_19720 [Burkholderiales bacterium]
MSHLLLTGAGFSKNWGGWLASEAFEYLLTCREIRENGQAREMLWKHQDEGGFETAIAEIRQRFLSGTPEFLPALLALQAAITAMFKAMNIGFKHVDMLNFSNNGVGSVSRFLTRFDSIFTLNQDVLLELLYVNDNVNLECERHPRWLGCEIPGMLRSNPTEARIANSWAESTWYPKRQDEFTIDPQFQPIFKLHGSSNWRYLHGQDMMIIGGAKLQDINTTPILGWYLSQFEEQLCAPNAKLMVIGYGFRDQHINDAIKLGVENGLKVFVIAPEGADLARKNNKTSGGNSIYVKSDIEEMFERSLIGASRRSLKETFGADTAEYHKVMSFFDA